MILNNSLNYKQLKECLEVSRLRRDCLHNEVQQLSNVLHGLTGSYRVLVDAAEEFNHIAFSSKDDVNDAVNRADDVGELIDEVIEVLGVKLKHYLRDVKQENICRDDFCMAELREEKVCREENYSKHYE